MEKQSERNSCELKSNRLSSELAWKNKYESPVSSIFLSFDERFVVVTGAGGDIRLIDAAGGAEKYCVTLKAPMKNSQIDDSTGEIFSFGRNAVGRISPSGRQDWLKPIQTPIIAGAISQYSKNFILCYEGNRMVIADYNATPRYKGGVDSKGPITAIYAPKFSPNFVVVTAAGDVFYMRHDGAILWQFCIKDRLNSVSTSKDGQVIFAGSFDNNVLCLHAEQRVLFNFGLKSAPVCTDISEDGKFFAAGCEDGNIYVLNMNGETVFFDRPFSSVSKIYLSDAAQKILTLSDGDTVSMYRIGRYKAAEERSKNISDFIEMDGCFADGKGSGVNKPAIDGFIEL